VRLGGNFVDRSSRIDGRIEIERRDGACHVVVDGLGTLMMRMPGGWREAMDSDPSPME
jgi:hypothetical protein